MSRKLVFFLALFALSYGFLPGSVLFAQEPIPTSTELANAGWNMLSVGDYNGAIALADQCEAAYKKEALRLQRQIRGDPPTGAVSEEDAQKIYANAVLNDVAACVYIKATAYERTFQLRAAIGVFATLATYRKARVWDPNVSAFWSPYVAGQAESSSPAMYQPLVQAGWDAINSGNFDYANNITAECIAVFGRTAKRLQAQLRSSSVVLPVGVVSPEDAERINQNYLLNDVAACYFIKAKAVEGLGPIRKARQAYNDVKTFTLARIFDPSWNGYWSPAEAAVEWLAEHK